VGVSCRMRARARRVIMIRFQCNWVGIDGLATGVQGKVRGKV